MWGTPGLLALFTAKLLSTLGSWLTMLALPWFVLVTTGSPVKMSAVLAAEFLGVVTLGLPSGKVVARLGVRRTMLICDAARVPLMALIPLLHQAGWLSLPALLAVSFGLGAFTAPYVSSQRLILAAFVRLPSTVDGADQDRKSSATSDEQGGVLAGLRHALRHRTLRLFVLALTLVTLSITAIYICLPVLVLSELDGDPRTLGLLTAANGAGLALGSLIAVTTLNRMNNTALTGAAILQCAPLWLLLADRTSVLASGLFLTGLATPVLAATLSTRITLRVPAPMRPHVMTAVITIENVAAFIGYTTAGPALQFSSLRTVFAVIATLATLGAITFAVALHTDRSRLAPLAPQRTLRRVADLGERTP